MVKCHLKRIAMPKTWGLSRRRSPTREKQVFVSRPNPGKPFEYVIPINNFLKELVFVAETRKEVKALLRYKHVLVNGKIVRDEKFPVGLFDVVEIQESEKCYRLSLTDHGKMRAIEIPASEKSFIPRRIEDKTQIPGGKIQYNLFGGANIISSEKASVDDVLCDGKVLKLEKGATVMLISGNHRGQIGKVIESKEHEIIVDVEEAQVKTLKKYAYVLGGAKSIITV
jgi:small subunit ribosomal protein S4e